MPHNGTTPDATTHRRVALVTGGTRGIGFGIARALAANGWNLVLSGVRPEGEISDARGVLEALGANVDYVASDISRAEDRAALVASIRSRHGALHALINNAGRAPRVRADLLEAGEDSFEELIRTNLQGPYFLTQSLAIDMVARREADRSFQASIVFVTSVSAVMASINRGDYCVSKAGLAMTVKLFSARLASHGIPVYEVRPGIIATDMTSKVREVYDRRIADGLVPEGRWGTPDDVGNVVAALVRGDMPYSTGTVINVDGGVSVERL
jgi:NAD(P)-dependent dehydrogenase (short-subunit alcohol dehydrogenase family)